MVLRPTSRNKAAARIARRGERGFTVLEATLALTVTLGVALGAMEILRVTTGASEATRRQAAALAAAESALARIGADLPTTPGRWESRQGDGRGGEVRVLIELVPFETRATLRSKAAASPTRGALERIDDDPDDENRLPSRGRAFLATVVAEASGAGRPVSVGLTRIVIAPLEEGGDP